MDCILLLLMRALVYDIQKTKYLGFNDGIRKHIKVENRPVGILIVINWGIIVAGYA